MSTPGSHSPLPPQAARAVLQNQAQITQMLADLNRVDFTNVQEQVTLSPASRLLPPASCLLAPSPCLLPPAPCLLPPASFTYSCPCPQASWVCGCDEAVVSRLEESFKATLEQVPAA